MPFEYTATGRYYRTYLDGVYQSQHTAEREAIENCNVLVQENPDSEVYYIHEYEVRVVGSVAPQEGGDTEAPSTPGSLQATTVSATRIDLTWTDSTDNVGVTGYQVFQDGSPLDTTVDTQYTVLSLSPGTQYSFEVSAFDAEGNNSPNAGPALATTDSNSAPVWALGNQSGETGGAVNIDLDAVCADSDGDSLTYSLVTGTLPAGLSLTGSRNETLSGTLSEVDVDTFTLRADDGLTTTDVQVQFTVTAPDTTAPAVPTGLASGATTQSTVPLNWDDNSESDLSYYSVYRSTDNVSFGKVTVDGEVTTSDFTDSGRSANTTYYYTVTATDDSGNESAQSSSVSATTQDFGALPYDIYTVRNTTELATAGQSRTPPAWVTDGTFQWATEPQGVLTDVTANTASELQNYLNQSQLRITIPASFGTQSGSFSPTGSDLEIQMSNSAQLNVTGDFDLVDMNRVKWTGGNIICTSTGGRIRLRGTDMIFNDIYARSNGDTGNFTSAERLIITNSTIDQQGQTNNSWAVFTLPTGTQNNWLFGNVRLESDGQNNRFQNVDNLILLDCVFNPDNRSANSHRLHKEIDNMWHADNALGQGGFLSDASSGYAYGVGNATFERLLVHTSLRAILTDSEFSGTSTIQGSASRTTNTNTLSGTPSIGNLTDLGGNHYEDEDGNLNQQWDGSTYPAYWANVGAQR
jgi:hypothetical protein